MNHIKMKAELSRKFQWTQEFKVDEIEMNAVFFPRKIGSCLNGSQIDH
jgi:hypothetical protein